MVFAFAGDSTITRFEAMSVDLVRKETSGFVGNAKPNLFMQVFFLPSLYNES